MKCSQCGVEYTNPSTSGSGVCSGCSIGKRGHSFFNIQKVIEDTDRITIKELGSTRNTMTKQIPVEEADWERELAFLIPADVYSRNQFGGKTRRSKLSDEEIEDLYAFVRRAISTAVKEERERIVRELPKKVPQDIFDGELTVEYRGIYQGHNEAIDDVMKVIQPK